MSEVLRAEWPSLPEDSQDAQARWGTLHDELLARLGPAAAAAAAKIRSRAGARDGDLCGVAPMGLLALACEWAAGSGESSRLSALDDCLADVGQTCLQGDTHRIFSLLLAARRDCIGAQVPPSP